MIYYEDLLGVQYKEHGRSVQDGFDCYGLVIECCRRAGTPIPDLFYSDVKVDCGTAEKDFITRMNLEKVDEPKNGDIVECAFENNLHCGYIVDDNLNVLHATQTQKGIRLNNMRGLNPIAYYRVKGIPENEKKR